MLRSAPHYHQKKKFVWPLLTRRPGIYEKTENIYTEVVILLNCSTVFLRYLFYFTEIGFGERLSLNIRRKYTFENETFSAKL